MTAPCSKTSPDAQSSDSAAGRTEWVEHPGINRDGFVKSGERRILVVREELQTKKAAVGRKLIDVPGYVFRVFVTNHSDSVLEIWRVHKVERPWSCLRVPIPGFRAVLPLWGSALARSCFSAMPQRD